MYKIKTKANGDLELDQMQVKASLVRYVTEKAGMYPKIKYKNQNSMI